MNGTLCDKPAADLLATVASTIAIAKRHGLLTPTRVHFGMGQQSRPSERNLTMSDDLAAAVKASER